MAAERKQGSSPSENEEPAGAGPLTQLKALMQRGLAHAVRQPPVAVLVQAAAYLRSRHIGLSQFVLGGSALHGALSGPEDIRIFCGCVAAVLPVTGAFFSVKFRDRKEFTQVQALGEGVGAFALSLGRGPLSNYLAGNPSLIQTPLAQGFLALVGASIAFNSASFFYNNYVSEVTRDAIASSFRRAAELLYLRTPGQIEVDYWEKYGPPANPSTKPKADKDSSTEKVPEGTLSLSWGTVQQVIAYAFGKYLDQRHLSLSAMVMCAASVYGIVLGPDKTKAVCQWVAGCSVATGLFFGTLLRKGTVTQALGDMLGAFLLSLGRSPVSFALAGNLQPLMYPPSWGATAAVLSLIGYNTAKMPESPFAAIRNWMGRMPSSPFAAVDAIRERLRDFRDLGADTLSALPTIATTGSGVRVPWDLAPSLQRCTQSSFFPAALQDAQVRQNALRERIDSGKPLPRCLAPTSQFLTPSSFPSALQNLHLGGGQQEPPPQQVSR